MVMKIIITERQFDLIEQQLDLFNNSDSCHIDYDKFGFTMKLVFINGVGDSPEEREEILKNIKDSKCDVVLHNRITDEEFKISYNDIFLTKTDKKMLYVWKDLYDKKIFPFLTKISQYESFIKSKNIKKALEIAFPNYWQPETKTHVAGVVGILPIKTDNRGWSIVNFFNTKASVIDEIKLYLVRDVKNGVFNPDGDDEQAVIDWMSNIFQDVNGSDMKKLVDIQEKSINDNYAAEKRDADKIKDLLHNKNSNVDISGFGTKKDIIDGIDATIDGVTYQIKPLSYVKDNGNTITVDIGHSNANDYRSKPIDRQAFVSGKKVYVFNNNAILLKGKSYEFDKSDMIYPK